MPKPNAKQITSALKKLDKMFPGPGAMDLSVQGGKEDHGAYQTLVAVILSARTRDEQVLKLLPALFKEYPNPEALAATTPAKIEKKINTIGMYKQKAKNIHAMAKRLVDTYNGKVPHTMEDLVSLPGVGRKTASVVLAAVFETPAIAVDTHVHRVTNRLGWVKTKTPEKTEEALLKLIPQNMMRTVNRVFVKHGRYICISQPRCWACPLADVCEFKNKNLVRPKNAEAILKDVERREDELQSTRRAVIEDRV